MNELAKSMKDEFSEKGKMKAYKKGGSVKAAKIEAGQPSAKMKGKGPACYAMGGPGKMRKGEMSKSGKPCGGKKG